MLSLRSGGRACAGRCWCVGSERSAQNGVACMCAYCAVLARRVDLAAVGALFALWMVGLAVVGVG